jgi:hypothetical protein
MKLLLLLLPVALLAQAPNPPGTLRIVGDFLPVGTTVPLPTSTGTNNPLGFPQELAGWWTPPDTNVWQAEWSTNNGALWTPAGNEWAAIPPRAQRGSKAFYLGLHYTETGTNWLGTNVWLVRIRRIK